MSLTRAAQTRPDQKPSLLRIAGPAYFVIAFVARVPYAMMVVGVLTLVASARESISAAGLSSAAVGIGTACFGALLGAAADRFGQRRVLLALALANSTLMLLFAAAVYGDASVGLVLATAFGIGATAPQVAPMSRARLVGLIADRIAPERRARTVSSTMAYESAADETVFVLGPFFVGILAAGIAPWAPLVGAAVLTLAFVCAFALHPTGRRSDHGRADGRPASPVRDLFRARILVIVAGMFGVGAFFGTTLTSLTSFMADRGDGESAGVMYGIMGIGSAALALGVSILPARFTPRVRWIAFAAMMVAGSALVAAARDIPAMALALGLVGIGVGPTLVTQYSFGAAHSPAGRSTTVMTMLGSSLIVGQALGSALAGEVAERAGTDWAVVLPVIAAAVVLAAGAANASLNRPGRIVA
ncbi:MFS transporter [Microbacterium karelineae]|uniref:MFS transporter n=1 Tax=Microbacterium karelineae TaxID=2654283 RepID=UPI0012EAD86C|nr:MFS transporter [Microbacterium karelineae]